MWFIWGFVGFLPLLFSLFFFPGKALKIPLIFLKDWCTGVLLFSTYTLLTVHLQTPFLFSLLLMSSQPYKENPVRTEVLVDRYMVSQNLESDLLSSVNECLPVSPVPFLAMSILVSTMSYGSVFVLQLHCAL